MQEMEFQLPEGSLTYVKRKMGGFEGIEIIGYHGLAGQVVIPDVLPWPKEAGGEKVVGEAGSALADKAGDAEGTAEMIKVRSVAKKAFLSKKYLRSVTVPAGTTLVEDWAFAYCDALREVTFLGDEVQFGKAVFMECPSLRCVKFMAKSENCDGIGELMAMAVKQMDATYLLDAKEAGSREWLGKWDARMLSILRAADDEGYAKQILCGEEDYESADLDTYLTNSRKKKVRLLLLRLLWPMGLDGEVAGELKAYLLERTKGMATEETWQVVRDEYGDRREFYELFARLGCLTKENAPAVIKEIGEEYPEMKAFFLRWQAEHFTATDYFDDLEL